MLKELLQLAASLWPVLRSTDPAEVVASAKKSLLAEIKRTKEGILECQKANVKFQGRVDKLQAAGNGVVDKVQATVNSRVDTYQGKMNDTSGALDELTEFLVRLEYIVGE